MKKFRFLLIISALALLLNCIWLPPKAENAPAQSYDIAVLIDVSASMPYADPNRISIEAAKAFAYYYPSQAEYFKISVILYNTNVATVLTGVDVSKESGMNEYQARMDEIGNLALREVYCGMPCWAGDTDIGKALAAANNALASSTADKKAVMLFTDGQIELTGNPTGEQESISTSYACADIFAQSNTPIYAVGLNYNGKVDTEFMQKLATTTKGEFQACRRASELMGFFQNMYAYFVGGSVFDGGTTQTQPDVPSSFEVDIYGQAVSEANLVLFSNAVIKTYTVTDPSGNVVAKLTADGKATNAENCIVNRNNLTVNLKLLFPADGLWKIEFTSTTAGTVQLGEIFLYDLSIAQIAEKKITVGDTVTFAPALYNQSKGFRIDSKKIYENSKCTITVTYNGTNDPKSAPLNADHTGYELPITFTKPGKHQVTYSIVNDQFSVSTQIEIEVCAPNLLWSAQSMTGEIGEEIKFSLKMQNPLTNAAMSLPAYMNGAIVKASVLQDGKEVDTVNGTFADNGEIQFAYTPKQAGEYQFSATIDWGAGSIATDSKTSLTAWQPNVTVKMDNNNVALGQSIKLTVKMVNPLTGEEIASAKYLANAQLAVEIKCDGKVVKSIPLTADANGANLVAEYVTDTLGGYMVTVSGTDFASADAPFTVVPSQISILSEIADVSGSVLFGSLKKEFDLSTAFQDSDSDALTYSVEIDGKGITCQVDGSKLLLSATGGAKGTVKVTATDGRGAAVTDEIQVKVKSFIPLFIAIVVLVVLIAVGTPLILIWLKKRRTPRLSYRVRLAMNGYQAVYDIGKANVVRRAKPVMTLKEILTLSALSTLSGGDMKPADVDKMIDSYCGNINVTGYAFKEGLRIIINGKEKVFVKYMVNLPMNPVDENDWDVSITFGKKSDFNDEY